MEAVQERVQCDRSGRKVRLQCGCITGGFWRVEVLGSVWVAFYCGGRREGEFH